MAVVNIDLTKTLETRYNFPACDRLWLPKRCVLPNVGLVDNSTDAVVAVRIGDDTTAQPWAIQDGFVTSFSGPVDHIFVTVLSKADADKVLHFYTGTDVGFGHGSTDGLSPQFGGAMFSSVPSDRAD